MIRSGIRSIGLFITGLAFILLLLAGCAEGVQTPAGGAAAGAESLRVQAEESQGQGLKVVATTSIVGDVVRQVGGDLIQLSVLLPVGADPHGFQPTPQDIALVANADLVFAHGAGLEAFLQPLVENAGGDARLVDVSDGVDFISADEEPGAHGDEAEGVEEHTVDPHTWTDPNNVILWTENIEGALREIDPENAGAFSENAALYRQELQALDSWVQEQVEQIPAERRRLVVDHQVFSYFAQEYGFEQVGAIVPGFSTLAEPSAQEIAALEDLIHEQNVDAIFVGTTVNPSLAERIAADTGVRLVRVYTGSLSEEGGEAGNYLDYIRYNVGAIVNAMQP